MEFHNQLNITSVSVIKMYDLKDLISLTFRITSGKVYVICVIIHSEIVAYLDLEGLKIPTNTKNSSKMSIRLLYYYSTTLLDYL